MRLDQNLIVLPVLVQVVLTFGILLLLPQARGRALRAAKLTINDPKVRIGAVDWGEQATKVSRSFDSQFQLPVLFYAACGFALVTHVVDGWMIGLASLFALSRVVHAAIHIGPNRVPPRFAAFLVGVVALMAMWLLLGWRVLTAL